MSNLLYSDRLIAACDWQRPPFFTLAIPHYKQRRYLEVVLQSIFDQRSVDFEIVVSDDHSPDDSNEIIPAILLSSGRSFRYYTQPKNLGYDGNVRFCLSAARGHYVLMLGNDDALTAPETLNQLIVALQQLNYPEVGFTNFQDWSSGWIERRAHGTHVLGNGVPAAVQYYRSFSFISGLIFDCASAVQHATDRWDQSVFYQIYLASRILAAGGRLGALDISAVRKDVRVEGQQVPSSYAVRLAQAPWSFQARHTGIESVVRVAIDGVLPYVPEAQRSAVARRIIAQALTVSYPYWLFEYRRIANWSLAVGVARGMWPRKWLYEHLLIRRDRWYIWMLYITSTTAGLIIPEAWFTAIKGRLANFVRRQRQRTSFIAG